MKLSNAHKNMTIEEFKVYGLHFIAFLRKRGAIRNGCTEYSMAENLLRLYNVCYPEWKMDFHSLASYLYKAGYIVQWNPSGMVKFHTELPKQIEEITKKSENGNIAPKPDQLPKPTVSAAVQKVADSKTNRRGSAVNKAYSKTMPELRHISSVGMAPELKLLLFKIPKPMRELFNNNMKPLSTMMGEHMIQMTNIKNVLSKKRLEPSLYISQLKTLQFMEEYQQEKDMRQYDLNDYKIQASKFRNNQVLIYVPGLEDERPSVRTFDEIKLSEVNGDNRCISIVSHVAAKHVQTAVSSTFRNKFSEDQRYTVSFQLSRRNIRCCQHAIELAHKNRLVSALFPEIAPSYNKPCKNLHWFDKNIENNPEQRQAVCNIVARTSHPSPYLLFGPPGTGKTATLVETISQVWETQHYSHVLVCTPSNAAADEVTKRLLNNKIPSHEIHRMYGPSRKWEDIDEEIQPCSNFAASEAVFLPRDLIILKRIVVVTLMSCARLLALHLRENHFAYVFIDEGGQATEPETLIPLGLMSGSDEGHRGRLQGQLIIAGDPKQLGPSIRSNYAMHLLEKSMLERLMEQCAPYKKNETGRYDPTYITKLIQNFRSNQYILHVPNKLFYEDELVACGGADTKRAMLWRRLPKENFPLIFHATVGKEQREEYSPSVCNMDEIAVIMDYLKDLIGKDLGGRKLLQKDIGIVTPYRLQRAKISEALCKRNWNDVSVGTVEIFQGQERDVIILSTVRSVIFRHNQKDHLGFLSNPKRFNVAVTRAKSLLITVGNPKVLQVDENWLELMRYCKNNDAWRGCPFSLDEKLSHKEKEKLYAKKYQPKKYYWDPSGQLPIQIEDIMRHTIEIPENESPRRRRRMPKIPREAIPPPSPESDSGITVSPNNGSRTTGSHSSSISNAGSSFEALSTASVYNEIATVLKSEKSGYDGQVSCKSSESSYESLNREYSTAWENLSDDSSLSFKQNKMLDIGFEPSDYDSDSEENLTKPCEP